MVPAGKDVIAGLHVCHEPNNEQSDLTYRDAWGASLGTIALEDELALRHPSFVEILSAASSPAGVTAVRDDSEKIKSLRSDVEYWRGQTRASTTSTNDWGALGTFERSHESTAEVEDAKALIHPRNWLLKDIGLWAKQNADRILILPRAISSTEKSIYRNPESLYAALELLANEYRLCRLGALDRKALDAKLQFLGLECRGSVSPSVAGMVGSNYFIRWGGSKRLLDQHILKGASRDPRYCMRIYFTYDDTEKKVIVGSMPAHLENSFT